MRRARGPVLHGRRCRERVDREEPARTADRLRARPAGHGADGIHRSTEAPATPRRPRCRRDRRHGPGRARGGVPREARDTPLPRQHGEARSGALRDDRERVRRRRRARLDRRDGRRRSARADRLAARLRRDEDQGARLRAREAIRRSGRSGTRPEPSDARRRRLARGARALPGREARVQGAAARKRLIQLRTLTDGGQRPQEIARLLASFLERAERTLDLAIYDVNLEDDTEQLVLGTLRAAMTRGVTVRLLYNVDRRPPDEPAPPPPKTRPEEIEALPFETLGVAGWPDLMHHKYVVRDGASVWTGSTNWTDDSWSREENVIAVVDSAAVADLYAQNFVQLWQTKSVRRSGKVATEPRDGIRVWFAPKRGEKLARRIARWAAATMTWKPNALRSLLTEAPFAGKLSTPYAPGSVHDYMHAKVTVCDDTVFVGSFNLSHSGESNAENVL